MTSSVQSARARQTSASAGGYRLVRDAPVPAPLPVLDARQRAVVDHATGPLLVLGGPGTGKTTTLVEAVAERVRRGTEPGRILVLAYRRKAAARLRDRLAARLGTPVAPRVTTFHSYCYALVRAHQDPELFARPLRLFSGPEQDLAVRELLAGQAELARAGLGTVRWPDELRAALTTRGFADEVRAVLARTRELGLGPDALAAFARRTGRPDWAAAAGFLAGVPGRPGTCKVPWTTRSWCTARCSVAREHAADFDAVFVDEYQDTDPAQVRLLRVIAGGGRTLVAFGDPDQSIYAFRGADVGGILDFPEAFPRADGRPAPVAVLRTAHRAGAGLLAATRLPAQRMPLTRLPARTVREHREPIPAGGPGGRVEVLTYPTPGAETDNIADLLRRAHLEDGLPWREMAVLVKAGARSLPLLRRAFTAAGVPVEIDGDDLPLREEPAVAPLLLALRVAARGALAERDESVEEAQDAPEAGEPGEPDAEAGEPGEPDAEAGEREEPARVAGRAESAWLPVEDALTLLASPLGGLDAADLRRLGRALREEERAAGTPGPAALRRAVRPMPSPTPSGWSPTTGRTPRGARRLGELLRAARERAGRAAAPPRTRCGSCGTARRGRPGWSAPRSAAAPRRATPTGTWTRSARCSRPRPGPRSAPGAAARSTSWRSWTPRTSRPTP